MTLKHILKKYNITTTELAYKLGVTQSTVSQIINGNPTLNRIEAIATAIGVEPYELLQTEPLKATSDKSGAFKCPSCGYPLKVEIS